MTLTEFLLARIAEDERHAEALLLSYPWNRIEPGDDEIDPANLRAPDAPARVLAECEAKRRIVELHYSWSLQAEKMPEPPFGPILQTQVTTAETILRTLASVYADHPDFDPAWAI